jgi:hypothetical protein
MKYAELDTAGGCVEVGYLYCNDEKKKYFSYTPDMYQFELIKRVKSAPLAR